MASDNRIRLRDGLWLITALLLHAVVLLIPAQQSVIQRAVPGPVTVSLVRAEGARPLEPGEVEREPQRLEQIEPRFLQPEESTVEVVPEPIGQQRDFTADQSASAILDSLSRLRETPGIGRSTPQLGDKPLYRPPANWRMRNGQVEQSPDDAPRPERNGIVDRWLAADGSHNVIVQTPGGARICGRGQAWNPMNPLLEPVMMYRMCGGGERGFSMPERFLRSQRASRRAIGVK